MSKNTNICKEEMTYEERIEIMKKNMGLKFVDEGKKTLKDGKVLKGEESKENFNTKLNTLTFEMEELYPLDYEGFKKEFPKTIELVETVGGAVVVESVKRGFVIQGWAVRTNVDEIIENINKNVKGSEREKQIELREKVFLEIKRMKDEFDIEWNQDLFWKCWKIKEGEKRWNYLKNTMGEKLAKKTIDSIRKVGGLEFLEVLQKEIYGEE